MSSAAFHHEAVFYEGDDQFVDHSLAFVREGLARSEPVLVMVGERKLGLLRDALASKAADVHLVNMEVVGRNPARIIPAWSRFVAENAGTAGSMRGIGEPIWADRTPVGALRVPAPRVAHQPRLRDGGRFPPGLPYDLATLPEHVIAEARRSHPVLSFDGTENVSPDYCGIDQAAAGFAAPLAEPPAEAEEITVTLPALRGARRLVWRRAEDAGLGERAEDFMLAVNEVLSNSIQHTGEGGTLRLWLDDDGLVCEVRDHGHIAQPLIGRQEPGIGQIGGHGMWLVNLVCDLVQVRSSDQGSTIRMRMNRVNR